MAEQEQTQPPNDFENQCPMNMSSLDDIPEDNTYDYHIEAANNAAIAANSAQLLNTKKQKKISPAINAPQNVSRSTK